MGTYSLLIGLRQQQDKEQDAEEEKDVEEDKDEEEEEDVKEEDDKETEHKNIVVVTTVNSPTAMSLKSGVDIDLTHRDSVTNIEAAETVEEEEKEVEREEEDEEERDTDKVVVVEVAEMCGRICSNEEEEEEEGGESEPETESEATDRPVRQREIK